MRLTTLLLNNQKLNRYNINQLSDVTKLSLLDIKNAVHEVTGVSPDYLELRTRKREIVDARHLYCYFARMKTNKSLTTIGMYINRDHASVLFAIKKISDLMNYDYKILENVNKIKKLL